MSPALSPALIDQVLRLPPADQDRLVGLILDVRAGPPDDPIVIQREWKAEIGRRIEAVVGGTHTAHTIDESDEAIRKALDPDPS